MIDSEHDEKQPSDNQDASILLKIFSKDKKVSFEHNPAAFFFAISWISQLPVILCRFCRKYSLVNRLILFRVTAFPTFFDTVIPRRVLLKRPGLKVMIKCLFFIFFPNLDNRRNSRLLKILSALVNENGCKKWLSCNSLKRQAESINYSGSYQS